MFSVNTTIVEGPSTLIANGLHTSWLTRMIITIKTIVEMDVSES